jgi:hypothetical protein
MLPQANKEGGGAYFVASLCMVIATYCKVSREGEGGVAGDNSLSKYKVLCKTAFLPVLKGKTDPLQSCENFQAIIREE